MPTGLVAIISVVLSTSPAKPSHEDQCRAALASLVSTLQLERQAAKDPMLGPGFVAGVGPLFLDSCAKLSEADVACVLDKQKPEALRACEPAMKVFGAAGQRYVEQKDPGAFARYQKASMQTEAKANLRAISVGILSLLQEHPAKAAALSKAAPIPSGNCCELPGKKCSMDPKAYSGPGWKELDWRTDESLRYHYSITRTKKAGKRSIRIEARGDPACDGTSDVWELNIDEATLQSDDPHPSPR